MTYDLIEQTAAPHGLFVMGALHPEGEDQTILLLGTGNGFWPLFAASPEYAGGASDPLDRWSKRVIGGIAAEIGATCQFPSDGPPYPPFIRWALASGRFHTSPVGMMVHDRAGMMISLRGALMIEGRIAIPESHGVSPCDSCETQPCLTTCPVGALDGPYDVPVCKAWIASDAGAECLNAGCLARRACPISARHDRLAAQSAFHMKAFLTS